jgi:hypothetical protein
MGRWIETFDWSGRCTGGYQNGDDPVWVRIEMNPRCRQHGRIQTTPGIFEVVR